MPPRTYDVWVAAFGPPAGPAQATTDSAAAMIDLVDTWYERATFGRIHVRLAGFRQGAALDTPLCALDDSRTADGTGPLDLALGTVSPSPDSVGVLTLAVTAVHPCGYAGQAILGGPDVHINGYWDPHGVPGRIKVVVHEFGHSLGLLHAGQTMCPEPDSFATAGARCDVSAYGDSSEVMGGGVVSGQSRGFSAYHQMLLGVSPGSAELVVGQRQPTTRDYSLTAAYAAESAGGIRSLRLPDLGGERMELEYRPPDDHWALMDHFAEYRPGGGLQARIVWRPGAQDEPALDPVTSSSAWTSLVNTLGAASPYWAALAPGQSLHLPDGSTVTFLSEAGDGENAVTGPRTRFVMQPQWSDHWTVLVHPDGRSLQVASAGRVVGSGRARYWITVTLPPSGARLVVTAGRGARVVPAMAGW